MSDLIGRVVKLLTGKYGGRYGVVLYAENGKATVIVPGRDCCELLVADLEVCRGWDNGHSNGKARQGSIVRRRDTR